MSPSYLASAAVWLVATGFWFGLGGFGGVGIAGFMVYIGVCVLGGSLCGRYLS